MHLLLKTTFEENIYKFKSRLLARSYPKRLIETLLLHNKFTQRESVLNQKNEGPKDILPFVIQNHPGVPNLKKAKKTSATSGGKTNPSKKDRERAISVQHDELVVSEIRRSPLTPAPAHLTLEGNNQSKISLQNA